MQQEQKKGRKPKRKKRPKVRSSQLVYSIAEDAAMAPSNVRYVIELLCEAIVENLSRGNDVHLDGVGTLSVFIQEGSTREVDLTTLGRNRIRVPVGRVCKVSFRKASSLRDALNFKLRREK